MKKLKRVLREIILPASIITLIAYFILCFITWDINIATWGWVPRLALLGIFIICGLVAEADEYNSKKSVFGGKSLTKKIQEEVEDGGKQVSKLFQDKLKSLR